MAEREVTRAIILDDKDRVLLGKRSRGMGANQWALVGGKPDKDETKEETIVREVREELGVEFTPTFYKEEVDTATDPIHPWHVYFYTGGIKGTLQPKEDEISEAVYVGSNDLANYDIAFNHRERLEEFFRGRNR